MRVLMQAFESHKKAFKGSSQEMRIDLPAPLHKLTIAEQGEEGEFLRVEEGELVITKYGPNSRLYIKLITSATTCN